MWKRRTGKNCSNPGGTMTTDQLGQPVKVGDVVQLDPVAVGNPAFGLSFMTVSEVKPWGAIGYVQILGHDRTGPGAAAFYRAKPEEMLYVGIAPFFPEAL